MHQYQQQLLKSLYFLLICLHLFFPDLPCTHYPTWTVCILVNKLLPQPLLFKHSLVQPPLPVYVKLVPFIIQKWPPYSALGWIINHAIPINGWHLLGIDLTLGIHIHPHQLGIQHIPCFLYQPMHHGLDLGHVKSDLLIQNGVSNPLDASICRCGISNLKSIWSCLENPLHGWRISPAMAHGHELVGQLTYEMIITSCFLSGFLNGRSTLLQPPNGFLSSLITLLYHHQSGQFDNGRILGCVILGIQPTVVIAHAHYC